MLQITESIGEDFRRYSYHLPLESKEMFVSDVITELKKLDYARK